MPPEEADALFGACDAEGAGVMSYTALETCLSRQKGFTDAPPTPEVSGEAPREAPREAEAEAHAEAEAEVVSEGGSGAAYADDNGVTVTLTARQFELPLEYSGAITVVAGDLTATTS